MLLYRFRPFNQHTITELLTQKLHFSHPITWNDPFEYYEREWHSVRIQNQKFHRFACFAKNTNENAQTIEEKDMLQNILMWSHYAESHKGICIEYDKISHFDSQFLMTYDDYLPDGYINYKKECWKYENELRVRIPFEFVMTNTKYQEGINIPYTEIGLKIKAIYCGVKFTDFETLKIIRGNRDFEIYSGTVENYASIKFQKITP